jgi:hypothetical protein
MAIGLLSGCNAGLHELSVHAITDCAGEDLLISKAGSQSWEATCHRRTYDTFYDCTAGDTVVCRRRDTGQASKGVALPSTEAPSPHTDLDEAPRAGSTAAPQL